MSKYKVEFKLKQHTPIIHFQSDQSGATLRATELKPKFDRFLKEYAFNGNIPSEYKINPNRDALNYKVKIVSSGIDIQYFEKYPPLYFARDTKEKVISQKAIEITFISYKSKLVKYIDEYFEAFLAHENFATRQTKGYGSFYIQDKTFNPSLIQRKVYSFASSKEKWEQDIKLFYGLLRAGINEVDFRTKKSKFYGKSLMFLYARKMGITWEKKAIKEHFLNQHKIPENAFLCKDLLGLSTFENWGSYKIKVKKASPVIARYKSPIIFKPYFDQTMQRVYFYSNEISKNFLDQTFKISAIKTPLNLKTPAHFDIEDFLDFAVCVNLEDHIESKYHTTQTFQKLQSIFQTIKVS